MYAITLWQPWATLLATSLKEVETRSWSASPRLRLPAKVLIHAAARPVKQAELDMFYSSLPAEACLSLALIKEYPLSSIIGMVMVDSCEQMTEEAIASEPQTEKAFGLWEPGRWAWRSSNLPLLDIPIKCRGSQGLWRPDEETLQKLDPYLKAQSLPQNLLVQCG